MRLRTRIFLTLAAVLAVSFGVIVWWSETGLESRLQALAAGELERTAGLLVRLGGDEPFSDELAGRLARAADLRVTLIDREGRVVGDSDVPTWRLPEVENHAHRPEVRSALAGRVGSDRRASATAARALLYVAVPHPEGVLRVAMPVDAVEAALVRTRRLEILGIALGLLLALLLSRWVEGSVRDRAERMRAAVESTGTGGTRPELAVDEPGTLGDLARAIHALGGRLSTEVGALRSEKEDLDALFDSLEDGLAVVGPDGTVLRANPAFARWAGGRQVAGARFATLFRAPRVAAAVARARSGHRVSEELALGDRTLLLSTGPHKDGALVIFRDLTRLRRLEGIRRDFVANVSHELKTPLTSVVGFAEALAEGDVPAAQAAEFGKRILGNAGRMRRLVDDLLDLAVVESGGWRPRPQTVSVPELARGAWDSLAPSPAERGLELEVREKGLAPVRADPEALRQVLQNLFDNAVRFAPEGSRVVLSGRREGEHVRLEVADSGPGIPSAHRSRVFERFYRVDPARSRQAGGTGLGLAIVKHLVLGHGGEVGLESEVGLGTTVWFTLPAAGEPAKADAAQGPDTVAATD